MSSQTPNIRLAPYFLPNAVPWVATLLLAEKKLSLVFKTARRRRFGDFRALPDASKRCQISLNYNLPPYKMLVVFLHEMAHYYAHRSHPKAKPHGPEWRAQFRDLLQQAIDRALFPQEIAAAIVRDYFCHDSIATQACLELEGDNRAQIRLDTLPKGSIFRFENRTFQLGDLVRTRYRAFELLQNQPVLFSKEAPIEKVLTQSEIDIFFEKNKNQLTRFRTQFLASSLRVGEHFKHQGREYEVVSCHKSYIKCGCFTDGKMYEIGLGVAIDQPPLRK